MKIDIRPSLIHGYGVFAKVPIAEGERIGRFRGRRTSEDGSHVLWVWTDRRGWRGYEGTGRLRFLNHQDPPNSAFYGLDLYALRSVEPDEEITIHYGPDLADVA
jgi:SET domain-containing protein